MNTKWKIVFGFLVFITFVSIVYGFVQNVAASKAEQLALELKKIADQQRADADVQRASADQAMRQAEEQRALAEHARGQAEEQRLKYEELLKKCQNSK